MAEKSEEEVIWKPVPGLEEYFAIGSNYKIKNLKKNTILCNEYAVHSVEFGADPTSPDFDERLLNDNGKVTVVLRCSLLKQFPKLFPELWHLYKKERKPKELPLTEQEENRPSPFRLRGERVEKLVMDFWKEYLTPERKAEWNKSNTTPAAKRFLNKFSDAFFQVYPEYDKPELLNT